MARRHHTTRWMGTLAILGFAALAPLTPAAASDELLPPVRLKADGAFIDTGKHIAHSGPNLIDLDEDGHLDLLVGDFRGQIHFFRNMAGEGDPVYEAGRLLEAEGKAVKIPNW